MNQTLSRLLPPARLIILTSLAVLTMWLGQGCSRVDRRDPLTLGGEPVPTLAPAATPMTERGSSLAAGSRDHWERSTILVPIDALPHHPTYTHAQPNYSDSRRARGGYPSAETALELNSPPGPQAWEAIAAPFHGGADVFLFIPRAIATPPWTTPLDQGEPFDRAPLAR